MKLSEKDIDALAAFWGIFWGALVLNPMLRSVRGAMKDAGLVEPKGPLALTARGRRVMSYLKATPTGRARP